MTRAWAMHPFLVRRPSPLRWVGIKYANKIDDTRLYTSEEIKEFQNAKVERRVYRLRILMILSMLISTGILAYFAYFFFHGLEITLFEQQFQSSMDLLTQSINRGFLNTKNAALEFALTTAESSRVSGDWPNITMPAYEATCAYRLTPLSYRAIGIWPFVYNSSKLGFEAFAAAQVSQGLLDGSSMISTNPWPPSHGIYDKDSAGTKISATGDLNSPDYPDLFVPIWQVAPIVTNRVAMMYNVMSDSTRRHGVEYTITNLKPTLTDIIQLNIDGTVFRPSTQIMAPIISPSNSTRVLGILAYSFSWDTLLVNILADYIEGVDVVMNTPTTTATYTIKGSGVTYVKSDTHDPAFDYLRYPIALPQIGDSSITYLLTAYPTQPLYTSYLTDNPRNAVLIVVTVSLISLLIFVAYIYVVLEREKKEHAMLVRSEAEAHFTNFLAHEVRNPLSGIDSCSQLILDDLERLRALTDESSMSMDEDKLKLIHEALNQPILYGQHIKKCVSYIQNILNNTLDMTKLNDGRLDFQFKKVYLRYDILEMAMMMLSSMKADGVQVIIECPEDVYVVADPLRLTQVLINLLTNAFKFCKQGHVRVVVLYNQATEVVTMNIEDTGPGIPLEHRGKLFSKYGQIAVRQGTGLGLVLAQDMCKALNGKLYLSEEYLGGSCFVVELPGGVGVNASEAPGNRNNSNSASHVRESFPENIQVLLVDDSIAASKLLHRRFAGNRKDVVTTTALNGEEALRICEADRGAYDVVVMDENMQSTGGLLLGHQVVREMRTRLGMTRTAIIGCTGNAQTCTEDFIAAGADTVWGKPTPSNADMVLAIKRIRTKYLGEKACALPCGVKIALIDDSASNSKLLVRRVSKCLPVSWTFELFSSIDEFLGRINDGLDVHTFRVIITDQHFDNSPLLGSQLVRMLRDTYRFQSIIIGCSGDANMDYKFISEGANLFWSKPPPRNEDIVQQLFDNLVLLAQKSTEDFHPLNVLSDASRKRSSITSLNTIGLSTEGSQEYMTHSVPGYSTIEMV